MWNRFNCSLLEVHYMPSLVTVFTRKKPLSDHLHKLRVQGKRIGLVPTMGALHQGHISLLHFIEDHCDIRVCSIFVNPTQFNNADDLKNYPRPKEKDLTMLEEIGCEVVFMPEVDEMYGKDEAWHMELGQLDRVLEGAFRPGHYQGVAQVVKKLFDYVKPDVACFGQKDFQQYLVIEKMIRHHNLHIQLLMCPTVRDDKGLALSSRNIRLSKQGYQEALAIPETLGQFSIDCEELGIEEAKRRALEALKENTALQLEYFEVCNPENLQPIAEVQKSQAIIALIAAWVDGVRLIDNMIFRVSPKIKLS